ncbi:STAS/SEC14 domain-containing protein [Cystobacter ferrugineus]|uniref:STAS/SEC14 domain-containing protein n=1 Tax=Cystobacter ferrugineus TaxID=83449 RepID=A0A1L9B3M2_9BACT|nr:STAS/SEC14 domain-containing protein [Cystobacter ferrugineus]OJH36844.1 hypothetical protein BON30_30545 [Cystobacter ferrugineus]
MSTTDRVRFDSSRWPLLSLWFPRALSPEEYEAFLATFGEHLERAEQKLILLIDLREISRMSMDQEQRQRQVAWLKAHETHLRERVLGAGIILSSTLARLALRAILALLPLPSPVLTFSTPEEAESWAAGLRQQAGR